MDNTLIHQAADLLAESIDANIEILNSYNDFPEIRFEELNSIDTAVQAALRKVVDRLTIIEKLKLKRAS